MLAQPTPQEIVTNYFAKHYRVVMWPDKGELKGPIEKGWTSAPFTLLDFTTQKRVGLITGQEVSPGKFLHDVDIDWADGYNIALQFLPLTEFVYGRQSKHVSHCFYTLPEPCCIPPFKDPVDKTVLLEIRGTKENGELGLQSMVPPSNWEKNGKRELLEFRKYGDPTHWDDLPHFLRRCCYAAIGMLLAKRLGHNGFGHDARMAWAGYLLRANVSEDDMVRMGEAISLYCNNKEIIDVRRVVQSTISSLQNDSKRVKGGPALAKILGNDGKKIIAEINKWLGRDTDFVRNNEGMILKDHQENIRRALRLLGVELSYQEFAERMLVQEGEHPSKMLDDRTVNNLWLRIDRDYRFRPTFMFYEKVVNDAAMDNAFHPVRDYLRSVHWDGVPRVNHWLALYGGAEEHGDPEAGRTYLEAVSSIVLIAAVRRVLHPGCKYDEMLVLESEQGLNKSSALRTLCPYDEWFSDDLPLNVDAKEIIERTLGKWIIEASDLVGGRKADRDHLKSMLSRQIDGPARMAYARNPVERPRQFVIVGTTNTAEYLADSTGARRFWPVKVKRFDVESITKDRDQLWAEAVVREANGESIRLPEELWGTAGEHQEKRREVDSWEDAIRIAASKVEPASTGQLRVATSVLWEALGVDLAHRDRAGARRISEVMQQLGFSRMRVRTNDGVEVGYGRETPMDVSSTMESRKAPDIAPF